jgi:hypothetical protein
LICWRDVPDYNTEQLKKIYDRIEWMADELENNIKYKDLNKIIINIMKLENSQKDYKPIGIF